MKSADSLLISESGAPESLTWRTSSHFEMPRLSANVRVGCRVSGRIGELVDNPDQIPTPSGRRRRRVKRLCTGEVVSSIGLRKWSVRLDHNNTIVPANTNMLTIIDSVAGLPLVSNLIYYL